MHSEEILEEKLESYSSSIAANHLSGAWRRRVGHVPRYAAAVSSTLALATSANANIVYSGYQNVRTQLPGIGGQMNIGGARFTEDFYVTNIGAFGYAVIQSFFAFSFGGNPHQSVGSVLLGQTRKHLLSRSVGFAQRLNSGQVISSQGNFAKTAMLRFYAKGAMGQFQPGQFGFAGIRFLAPDGYHYGWMRIGLTDSPGGYPNQVETLDWAYDTVAGEAVTAGEGFIPGTVPEPDATPLLLLALGAVGVQAWRRNRPA